MSSAFFDPSLFSFVPRLEAHASAIANELSALNETDFIESPDSLTTVTDLYDETGWHFFDLFGDSGAHEKNQKRCPETTKVCRDVPGLVNAGFSVLRSGTHLYPHQGEMKGVLRCHLPLCIPEGDVGLRLGNETRHWVRGQCLIFDDKVEHEAWNHAEGDRAVLLITFEHDFRVRH